MPTNRIARTATEAHEVNRARFAAGFRHPAIHQTDEQRALNEMFTEFGTAMERGEPVMHVVQYAITVSDTVEGEHA